MRRLVLGLVFFASVIGFASAAELGDDGLHKEDWFSITFKDVGEDIAAAKEEGKRLAIVFEQRGCIYCRKMHEELLADPKIRNYVRDHFKMVQYNLFGDEEVTDLDGETLSEKTAARRWGVVFTPTILFMPDDVPEEGTAVQAAVATMPGAFGKKTFLHMFEWVAEKGYEGEEHFQKYHARKLAEEGDTGAE
ncbi:thioredoxin family protein [Jiella marina]|uniref:thioredoxin family protein n=1 Tax=Jiella sp. LLJ827 TaxID=2917712 RepID=UPI0021019AD1|nr:thioredoxin family protein [Jiella sp. LLJ827]MCQ0989295.1 thioredoxin family protein [Jiella sp. LLJ827]